MGNEFDIAIVGMSGRFPGARNLDEFWRNLAGGIESITRFSDRELLESGVPATYLNNPNYVKAAPILEEPGRFDAEFFGLSPMEAKTMDPQHRILLELAQEALEDAACDPDRYQGRIGVFTAAALNTYFTYAGLNRRLAEDYIPTLLGNDKDFLSTRISYKLNLKGPSITVQTACSSSMVAVHLARQSLLAGETDMALAGAISVRVPHRAGYFCDGGGIVSADGQVRAFDAHANGTVFGSGGGILVLKRLADAIADGDTVHAIIKGSAVNNDGSEKAGYSAPSVNAQADAVVEALSNAGIDADSIGYVEAHGSGTPVGDPIEVRALTKAFRTFTQRSGYCALGSVKTNVGHLDAAAAVAGLIKTVLALKHRKIPPSLHFSEPNPEIDFASTPFFVNSQLRDWPGNGARRAGVMSTGMGGTNAHVVLEEAPVQGVLADTAGPQLLLVSAKTETALDDATLRLREYLVRDEPVNLSDIAHTLQTGRTAFAHRRFVVCNDRADAVAALGPEGLKRVRSGRPDEARRPLVLLLPGVGDHYVGMAHDLYETWPIFREEVDRCARILEPHLGTDVRNILYPSGMRWKVGRGNKGIDLKKMIAGRGDAPDDPDSRILNETVFVQPALFTAEYATARLWESLGVVPDAIVGHSMGEYVAACLAGVLSLEDALRLIAKRARLVNELPKGAMLAVTLSENELLPLLSPVVSISLINGPSLCVVAGPVEAVSELERVLTARGVLCRRVQNAHAFHSRMLDPIVPVFEAEVKKVRLNAPRIRYMSNVSGTWITAREATSPAYWARHANSTARFSDALRELWKFQDPILLEAGPGQTIGVLAMQHPDRKSGGNPTVLSSIRNHYESRNDVELLMNSVGGLWLSGLPINWSDIHRREKRRKVSLPTYPFERKTYWIDDADSASKPGRLSSGAPDSASTGIESWFYVPAWERMPDVGKLLEDPNPERVSWLIFGDRYGGGERVKSKLEGLGLKAELVRFGAEFGRRGDGSYELNPKGAGDYLKLFGELQGGLRGPLNILHLGALTRERAAVDHSPRPANQDFGFYSLLHIAQAIGDLNVAAPVKIGVISNRIHDVTGEEGLNPEMAPVLGPCGVIPKEYANVTCFNIDLAGNEAADALPDEALARIVSEFSGTHKNQVVAYRGRYRWGRTYRPVRLPGPVMTPDRRNTAEVRRLRTGGVYLITGGTGGLGLVIAKYLATTCRPRIVLTRKTVFPPKSTWRKLALAAETPSPVRKTLNSLLELEDLGAEVEVHISDASDHSRMRRVVGDIVSRFGTIHGVFHAAGIVRAGLMQAKTRDTAESVLAPKVHGSMILFDLLKDIKPDFLVLFSSITSVLTPYAESDYSAANAFLDAFCNFANAQGAFRTISINWPGWREVGQLADLETLPGVESWKEAAISKAIATKDGLEAFKRVLNSDFDQVVVSPQALDQLLETSALPFDPSDYLSRSNTEKGAASQVRNGVNVVDQPTNQVEADLVAIWSDVFGLDQIGIHDDFARLRGHSLQALQIVSKVRSSYQIGFTLKEFFEAPTIAQLSSAIQKRITAEIDSLSEDEARRLIAVRERSERATSGH